MTHLAELLNVKPSGITVLMDRLVELEFVKRTNSEEDRRVVMLEIKPKGLELFNQVLASHNDSMKEYFWEFEESEISDFLEKIKKFEKAIDLVIQQKE